MIFSPILETVRKDELLEKIAIYTQLVHIVAESNNVSISICPKIIPQELINELIDIQ